MNRTDGKKYYFRPYLINYIIIILSLFFIPPIFSQTKVLVLPGERMVRVDKGEPAMTRKVMDYQFTQSGYYRILGRVWYNSGDLQKNESFFLDVRTPDGRIFAPLDSNVAGPYRVIADEPGPPHHSWKECGLFHLSAGRYGVWMHHYALISDRFPQFLNGAIVPEIPESVRMTDSLKVIFYPSTDGKVKGSVTTREQKLYQNEWVDVIQAGESFTYHLVVTNAGNNPLIAPVLKNVLPDGIIAENFSLIPSRQNDQQVEWLLPDLSAGDSIVIHIDAKALRHFPAGFTLLQNNVQLEVVDDVDLQNNVTTIPVYGFYQKLIQWADLQITLIATSDSSAIIGGEEIQIVKPQGKLNYDLTIKNNGPDSARALLIHQKLPPYLILQGSSDEYQLVGVDSVIWSKAELAKGQSLTISLWGQLDPQVPQADTLLVSQAQITAATPDSILTNNFSQATVHVAHPTGPEHPPEHYDLQLSLQAFADSSIIVNGKNELAQLVGEKFSYNLSVFNHGPAKAKEISILFLVPDSLDILSSSIIPWRQKQDSLFWKIDSLPSNSDRQILLTVATKAALPDYPFPLPAKSQVSAPEDTLLMNNQSEVMVYAVQPYSPPQPENKNFDLALQYQAITDTSMLINGQMQQAVVAGKRFGYQITLKNNGPRTAKSVSLWATVPDSIKISSQAPFTQKQDTLFWHLDSLAAQKSWPILLFADVPATLPDYPFLLRSSARVIAANDTTSENNQGQATVYAIKPFTPPKLTSKNFDLALQYQAITDTSVLINGQIQQAVVTGKRFSYQIILKNNGPRTAKDILLWALYPDSLKLSSQTPFTQKQDTLFWRLDSLTAQKSWPILLFADVPATLPDYPFLLLSSARVIAANDTTTENNQGQATVYAIKPFTPPQPKSKNYDLALQYRPITESTIEIDGQMQQAVIPGSAYSSQIVLTNNGPSPAKDVALWARVPANVAFHSSSMPIKSQKEDTLFWQLDSLPPATSTKIAFAVEVPSSLPHPLTVFSSTAEVWAAKDTTANNNRASYKVYAEYNAPMPDAPIPYIVAKPAIVEVSDSVTVMVKVEGEISQWDLWVHFANGQIDSSYADDFIQINPLLSGIWREDLPLFGNTRLVTAAREEKIIFELRIKDEYGRFASAETAVLVHSQNRMRLDRNVYEPDRQQPLAIHFKLSSNRIARLDVYDIAGTHITKLDEDDYQAGWNTYYWDGKLTNGLSAGSGVYIITIRSDEFRDWKKCMIVR